MAGWKTRGANSDTGLTSWSNGDPFDASVLNDIDYDFRTWGANVDAGGFRLANCEGVAGPAGANPLIFYTNGSERVRVLSSGYVGIGTTTPATTLQVSGATSAAPSASTITEPFIVKMSSGLNVGVGSLTSSPYSAWMQASDKLGNTFPLVLNPIGGNVGIGTVTPQAVMSITGASAVYNGSSALTISTGTGASTDETLTFGVHNGDYSWIQAIKQGTGVRALLINPNGGKVGIGVTSPGGSPFSVAGLPSYASNSAAISGGLAAGDCYLVTSSNPRAVAIVF
jgi:hypothetical protein